MLVECNFNRWLIIIDDCSNTIVVGVSVLTALDEWGTTFIASHKQLEYNYNSAGLNLLGGVAQRPTLALWVSISLVE